MGKTVVCDCCYNVSKQLSNKLGFLWRVDGYIKDAKKQRHGKCAAVWKKIAADEKKHVELLKKCCSQGVC